MPKIRLELARDESYALLAATEFLRQIFGEEDGGIPPISVIVPISADREFARLDAVFAYGESDYVARVKVPAGGWPKKGTVLLTRVDGGGGRATYDVKLNGNPAYPVVKFKRLAAGTPAQ